MNFVIYFWIKLFGERIKQKKRKNMIFVYGKITKFRILISKIVGNRILVLKRRPT
jgi:hypothetical protein